MTNEIFQEAESMGVPYIEATVEGDENFFQESGIVERGLATKSWSLRSTRSVVLEDLFRQFDKMGPIYK